MSLNEIKRKCLFQVELSWKSFQRIYGVKRIIWYGVLEYVIYTCAVGVTSLDLWNPNRVLQSRTAYWPRLWVAAFRLTQGGKAPGTLETFRRRATPRWEIPPRRPHKAFIYACVNTERLCTVPSFFYFFHQSRHTGGFAAFNDVNGFWIFLIPRKPSNPTAPCLRMLGGGGRGEGGGFKRFQWLSPK